MLMTFVLAKPTARLVFDTPVEYVDRSLPTASWWDRYEIQPGVHEFEWVDSEARPWNPDPRVHTSGFVANTGPYFGRVAVKAILKESYRENRLLNHVRPVVTRPDRLTAIVRCVYAYQLPGSPKGQHGAPLAFFMGGRVEHLTEAGWVW